MPLTFCIVLNFIIFFIQQKVCKVQTNQLDPMSLLDNIAVLLQLMAVGNQAGKTFVWDIGVDDPTKARYSFLVVNVVLVGSFS